MAEDKPTRYAEVAWNWTDIQQIHPEWDEEKCEEELSMVADNLEEIMIERGWEFLHSMI